GASGNECANSGHSQDLVKPRGPTAHDYRVAMPCRPLDGREVRAPLREPLHKPSAIIVYNVWRGGLVRGFGGMKQLTLATAGFERYAKRTRRAVFLAEMERVVPWSALCALIEPFYPKSGNGHPLVGVERML